MKFSIAQELFSEHLAIASRAIASNTTLPVLEHFLLRAEGSILTLVATDLEISIKTYVDCIVEEEGSITVPAKMLTQYISLLPSKSIIEAETTSDGSLFLKTSHSQTAIKGLPSEEFPSIPKVDPIYTIGFEKDILTKALRQVLFSTSTVATRPVLSGVTIQYKEGTFYFVTTDSFRLSEKTYSDSNDEYEGFRVVVPAKTMQEIEKVLSKDHGARVEMLCSKNQLEFSYGSVSVQTRLIEGQLPEYGQIIPKEILSGCLVNCGEMILALKRLNLFTKEHNFSVKLHLKPTEGVITLSSDDTQIGHDKTDLPVNEAFGPDLVFNVNALFVIDVLGHSDGEYMKIEAKDERSPLLFKNSDLTGQLDASYVHLIMPLRG